MRALIESACRKGFRILRDGTQQLPMRVSAGSMPGSLAVKSMMPTAQAAGVCGQVAVPWQGLHQSARHAGSHIQLSAGLGRHVEAANGRDGNAADIGRSFAYNQTTRVYCKAVDAHSALEVESRTWSSEFYARRHPGAAFVPPSGPAFSSTLGNGARSSRSFTVSAATRVRAPVFESMSADTSDSEAGGKGEKSVKATVVSKQGLVERLATRMAHNKTKAADWLNATIIEITEGVKKDELINLKGFGTLERVERTFRMPVGLLKNRHPGAEIDAAKSTTVIRPVFSPSKPLVAFVNDPTAKDGKNDGSVLFVDPKRAPKKEAEKPVVGIEGLSQRLSARMAHTPEQAYHWLSALLTELAVAMAKGEKVQLTGFGSFESKEREYKIPSKAGESTGKVTKARPFFSAGKGFVTFLNDPNAKPVAPVVQKKSKESKEKEAGESTQVQPKVSLKKAPAAKKAVKSEG